MTTPERFAPDFDGHMLPAEDGRWVAYADARRVVLHDISRQIRALPKVHGPNIAISDEALSEREAAASFIDEVAGL